MVDFSTMFERPSHIEYVLLPLHPGAWFTWSNPSNKIYANLVIRDVVNGKSVSYDKPTERSLKSALATAQSDWDATKYARNRLFTYPSSNEFIEAYCEKEIGGDSTKWDAYVIAYNKVRTDNPKPREWFKLKK